MTESSAATTLPPPACARLQLTGDLMLAGGIATGIKQSGPQWPCSALRDTFSTASLLIGNLELPFTAEGIASSTGSRSEFRCDPDLATALEHAPWSLLTLATNHCLDWGAEGIHTTRDRLTRLGIPATGAGANLEQARRPVVLEREGIRFGCLAYAKTGSWSAERDHPGAARLEMTEIIKDVSRLREEVDHVIVSLHWGVEYCPYPAPEAVELAHAIADAGARLIVGHHPHTLQGIERYRDTIIAYSLGNFIADTSLDLPPRPEAWTRSHWSGVLQVDFSRTEIIAHELLPVVIGENLLTRPATEEQSAAIKAHVAELSTAAALDGSLFYTNAAANIWQREAKAVWRRLRTHGFQAFRELLGTVNWRHLRMLAGALLPGRKRNGD